MAKLCPQAINLVPEIVGCLLRPTRLQMLGFPKSKQASQGFTLGLVALGGDFGRR